MKRFLALALSFLMLLGILLVAGCGEDPAETTGTNKPQSTTASSSSSSSSSSSEEDTSSSSNGGTQFDPTAKMPGYEDIDFGGRTFVIVGCDGEADGHDSATEIYMAEDDEGSISLAVDERNQLIEALYNCKIQGEKLVSPGGDAANNVLQNGNQIDIFNSKYAVKSLATDGKVYNLLTLGSKTIDFSQDWWDQEYIKSYKVKDSSGNDKLYSIVGDFALTSFDCTHALVYNKTVYSNTEKIRDIDIYQLVRDHKWTLDTFTMMVKEAAVDNAVPGTYKIGDGDIVGWLRTTHATHGLHTASGLKIMTTVNGTFQFEVQKNINAWTGVMDKACAAWALPEGQTVGYSEIPDAVAGDQCLFASEILGSSLGNLATMDNVNIGILPYPVYTEGQEYAHYVDNHLSSYAVPLHVSEIEAVGDFFAIYAYYSRYIVRPAYINFYTLEVASDEPSAEMLDIILSTRTYDPGYLATNYEGEISTFIDTNKPQTISNYASSKAKLATTFVNDFVTAISKNKS